MNSTVFAASPVRGSRARRLLAWLAALLPSPPTPLEDRSYLHEQLLNLILVSRALIAVAGVVVVATIVLGTDAKFPWLPVLAVLAVLAAASWAGLHRARQSDSVQEMDLLLQMICDIVVLTVVLSLAAGRKSPFDHLYVLPVLLGAHALSGWRLAFIAAVITVGWTTVNQVAGPGPVYPEALEIAGHLASGGLLAYVALGVARVSQMHERILSGCRERAIGALGAEASSMVATRAAHLLGTPLATMAVLVSDLRHGHVPEAEQPRTLEMLAGQIDQSKHSLTQLLEATGVERAELGFRASIEDLLFEIREECLIYYPAGDVRVTLEDEGAQPPAIVLEVSLFNALAGLVKDYLREPPKVALISATWDAGFVLVRLGGGRAEGTMSRGRRIERVAALASIVERHGGSVVIEPGAGRRISVRLPRADLRSIAR